MSPRRPGFSPVHLPQISPGDLARLLFDWPVRQAPRLALPACIVAAGLLQAGIVLLFSIRYPAPSAPAISSPQVYFLPPDSRAAKDISAWLEANDPAAFCPIRASLASIPPPPPLRYRASYEEPPPALRTLKVPADPVEPPLLPPDGSALFVPERALAGASPAAGTSLRWLDGLAGRTPLASKGDDSPPSRTPRCVQSPVFDIGVDASGIPRHCLVLESSGDESLDESLHTWLLGRRFAPGAGPSWGRVQILWDTGSPVPAPSAAR
jgi:hypothetical protein